MNDQNTDIRYTKKPRKGNQIVTFADQVPKKEGLKYLG